VLTTSFTRLSSHFLDRKMLYRPTVVFASTHDSLSTQKIANACIPSSTCMDFFLALNSSLVFQKLQVKNALYAKTWLSKIFPLGHMNFLSFLV
jgi:hypothetical protein